MTSGVANSPILCLYHLPTAGDRYRFSEVHIVNLKGKGPTAARFLLGKNGA